MQQVNLNSPLRGWAGSLEEAPDPVFSSCTLGDGFLIDPVGTELRAPCAGEIISIPETKHAILLRAKNGAEILMHIGIETVALGGEGFTPHVTVGQQVSAGDLLLSFDMNILAERAKSLLTPVIIANGDQYDIIRRAAHGTVDSGDFLMTIRQSDAPAIETYPDGPGASVVRKVVVALPHGIHARPAAMLSTAAKKFQSRIRIIAGAEKSANAHSPVGLMTLGVRCGDEVTIMASGTDADAAIQAIIEQLSLVTGQEPSDPETRTGEQPSLLKDTPVSPILPGETTILHGVTGAPGLALGKSTRLQVRRFNPGEQGGGIQHELAELDRAFKLVTQNLEAAARTGSEQQQSILTAHIALLDDADLMDMATGIIESGKSAGYAWRVATGKHVEALRSLNDPRMLERTDDLLDLENQILAALAGIDLLARTRYPPDTIIIADDLLPSQLVPLIEANITAIAIIGGGPTSHVSILAADQGIPTLVATDRRATTIPDGTAVILDAGKAQLIVAPDNVKRQTITDLVEKRRHNRADALRIAAEGCKTADGVRIEVFANLASVQDARAAVELGAEGCGLLRTEFLYFGRTTPPSEEEQRETYQDIADALDGRPLVIRTLDIGSDKPVPFLGLPTQENPALGLRGIRVSLRHPELLVRQYRAILGVRSKSPCHIMLPMISSMQELTAARDCLHKVCDDLKITTAPSLGIMVETPSSAILAEQFAREADFLSIGTNDLTQYALAIDRGNADLAHQIDSLHPAVIQFIRLTADAGRKNKKWVGVCGALASELVAAPVLIGLGVTELSTTATRLPELKAFIRTLDARDCQEAMKTIFGFTSAEAVRDFVRTKWPHVNDWA